MAQPDQYNVQDVVHSLASSIQEKLVKPSENKFTSLLEKTREDLDARTTSTEEQIYRRIEEMDGKIENLKKTQNKMGTLCLTLSIAVVVSIVIQVL
jgi:hypothetical protein